MTTESQDNIIPFPGVCDELSERRKFKAEEGQSRPHLELIKGLGPDRSGIRKVTEVIGRVQKFLGGRRKRKLWLVQNNNPDPGIA